MSYAYAPQTFVAGKPNRLMLYDYDNDDDFSRYDSATLAYTDGQNGKTYPCQVGRPSPVIPKVGPAKAVIIEVTPPVSCVDFLPGCLGRFLRLFQSPGRIIAGTGNLSGGLHGGGHDGEGGERDRDIVYPINLQNVQVVLPLT
jgi:hypothetical protein